MDALTAVLPLNSIPDHTPRHTAASRSAVTTAHCSRVVVGAVGGAGVAAGAIGLTTCRPTIGPPRPPNEVEDGIRRGTRESGLVCTEGVGM